MRPRNVILICLALAALLGFVFSGAHLYNSLIGLDATAFPAGEALQGLAPEGFNRAVGGVVWALGAVLAVSVLTFFAAWTSSRAWKSQHEPDPTRRSLLTGSLSGALAGTGAFVLGAAGMAANALQGIGNGGRGWQPIASNIFGGDVVKIHPEWKDQWKGARVKRYGRLGRTEWPISDIVVGTGPLSGDKGTEVVKLAIERGVNYIDTSPDYTTAGSEHAVGRAIRGVPRDQLFLATKFCTPLGHLAPGTSKDEYKQAIYDSLGRLGADYVDLIHVHSCDEVDRLMDPQMHAAFAELKAEGKARFLGFSTHTPNLVEVVSEAIDSGRFDVMMVAYHHGIWSQLDELIRRARSEQDMGVVAMKTLKGARHHGLVGFQNESNSYAQAALKWVASNENVSCAIISFTELQHVDEYLHASGEDPSPADVAILRKYDQQIVGSYCAPHCGACLDSCPEDVPIHDVLRHRMYFEDYGWEKEAMRLYSRLEVNASQCTDCSAPCLGSCPLGIPIPEKTSEAHELLTLV